MVAKQSQFNFPTKISKVNQFNVDFSKSLSTSFSQGYIENAPQCSGHGTYMCGICQCAADFFGRRCECDADNLSFHGDLEAGCRPDNTTTTLCNNRGDCICGKCECYPRENPNEVP